MFGGRALFAFEIGFPSLLSRSLLLLLLLLLLLRELFGCVTCLWLLADRGIKFFSGSTYMCSATIGQRSPNPVQLICDVTSRQ